MPRHKFLFIVDTYLIYVILCFHHMPLEGGHVLLQVWCLGLEQIGLLSSTVRGAGDATHW